MAIVITSTLPEGLSNNNIDIASITRGFIKGFIEYLNKEIVIATIYLVVEDFIKGDIITFKSFNRQEDFSSSKGFSKGDRLIVSSIFYKGRYGSKGSIVI